jgi:anti-sigma factor RsiW
MIDCEDCSARLDAFLDGGLPDTEREEVLAHLAACRACQSEETALRSILTEARGLPKSIQPERDLWTGIVARLPAPLASPGERHVLRSSPPQWLSWGQLAAALGLVLFGAALGTVWARRTAPPDFAAAQTRYTTESGDLARKLAANPGAIAPATRAAVQRNLTIIDQAIAEAEAALASDPGNTPLEQMLVARYEQRLALLRHALDAGRSES